MISMRSPKRIKLRSRVLALYRRLTVRSSAFTLCWVFMAFPLRKKGLRPACPAFGQGPGLAMPMGCIVRFQSNRWFDESLQPARQVALGKGLSLHGRLSGGCVGRIFAWLGPRALILGDV